MKWDWEKSLRAAIRAGISISEYDEMTPYQLSLYIEEYNEKQKTEAKEKLILTYLNAAWVRTKRMPNLKRLLNQIDHAQLKPMTAEQILERVKQINAALGGTVIKEGGD